MDPFEVVRVAIATLGRPAFLGEARGRPEVPYAVVNADWEPEPDIGQELLSVPGAQRISIQVNSYGRTNTDTLWLDSAIYTLLMREETPLVGVNTLFRDGDDSPVLSRTDEGLILSKHWYRLVYS